MNLNKIKQEYAENKSLRKTATLNNVSRVKLTTFLLENSIKIQESKASKKLQINSNYFNNIDTNEKAYWFGFLTADAYIDEKANTFRLELKKEDKEHLIKFATALGVNNYQPKHRSDRDTYYIGFGDKQIVTDLKKHGLCQNKSLTTVFPNLSQNVIKSFICGYFDGDGTIYGIGKKCVGMAFISTLDMATKIQEVIKQELLITSRIRQVGTKNVYRLEVTKTMNALDIVQWLYKESSVYLLRKFNKFKTLQERTSTTTITQPSL